MNADLVWIFISAMVVNNFTLFYFLGLCPFMGVSGRVSTALRMGAADTFVLLITALVTWVLNTFVLRYAPYLTLLSFIVTIASVVQIVEMAIRKYSPRLFQELGQFLPLITTNCAILYLAIFQTNRGYGFMQGIVFALGAGAGLTLALVLMASLREQVDLSSVPDVAEGSAMIFLIAGFLSLVFMGFAGLSSAG
ncbi:MAG: electron transport complex protein RnfA [Gemmatimonadota bacterium]